MKNQKIKTALPYLAVALGLGAATYSFLKTYFTVKHLGDMDLDFGNDDMLSSIFTNKKVTNEE